jgi:hypothetical protein
MYTFTSASPTKVSRPMLIALFAGILLYLSACQVKIPTGSDADDLAAVRDSVGAMANAIARDVTAEGPNAWLRYFEQSPQFSMASDGRLAFAGYDSAAAFVPAYARGVRSIELTWKDMNIEPLSASLALMRSPFHELITDTSGHQVPTDGYFTGLAEHSSNGWQLRSLHWSIIH